jgi:hypothetical protein
VLLAAVALSQLWLAYTEKLSAWSGGGFGMFSTADVFARRHLHAQLLAPGVIRELEVPVELRMQARRALALPTDARLRALGEALAAHAGEPADAISLTVYARRFDRRTLAPSGELLKSVSVELRDTAP